VSLIIENPVFGIAVTLFTYYLGLCLRKRKKSLLFHPFLISLVLIILILELFNIDYASYNQGGEYITYLLQPATVALAVPMYRKIDLLRKKAPVILGTTFVGAVWGILIVLGLGYLTGTGTELLISMVPKATTTPIAVGISAEIGGQASLTVGMVILNGLLGGMFGLKLLKYFKITSPIARGLSMGMSAHGIGTGRILEESEAEGAVSGLAIGLMGFFTALTAPLIIGFFF